MAYRSPGLDALLAAYAPRAVATTAPQAVLGSQTAPLDSFAVDGRTGNKTTNKDLPEWLRKLGMKGDAYAGGMLKPQIRYGFWYKNGKINFADGTSYQATKNKDGSFSYTDSAGKAATYSPTDEQNSYNKKYAASTAKSGFFGGLKNSLSIDNFGSPFGEAGLLGDPLHYALGDKYDKFMRKTWEKPNEVLSPYVKKFNVLDRKVNFLHKAIDKTSLGQTARSFVENKPADSLFAALAGGGLIGGAGGGAAAGTGAGTSAATGVGSGIGTAFGNALGTAAGAGAGGVGAGVGAGIGSGIGAGLGAAAGGTAAGSLGAAAGLAGTTYGATNNLGVFSNGGQGGLADVGAGNAGSLANSGGITGGAGTGGTTGGALGKFSGVANQISGVGGGGMAGGSWTDWIGPAISAGSALIGGDKANKANTAAARAALAENARQFDLVRGDTAGQRALGDAAIGNIANLYGYNASGKPDMSGFFNSPDYQYNLAETTRGVENSAAARGGLLSGGAAKALQRNASGLASRQYDSFVDRLLQQAGIGSTGIGASAAAGANSANNVAGIQGNLGNARASTYMNTAANVNNSVQQGFSNQLLQRYLNNG